LFTRIKLRKLTPLMGPRYCHNCNEELGVGQNYMVEDTFGNSGEKIGHVEYCLSCGEELKAKETGPK